MSTKYLTSSKDIAKGEKGRTIPFLLPAPPDASAAESLLILPIATSPPDSRDQNETKEYMTSKTSKQIKKCVYLLLFPSAVDKDLRIGSFP